MSARFVHGTTLERGDAEVGSSPTFTNIVGLVSVGLPVGSSVDDLESTVLSSPDFTKEYIPGLVERSPCPFTIRFDPSEASHVSLQSASNARKRVAWRWTIPHTTDSTKTGARWVCNGWATLDVPEAGSGILDVSGTIRVAGAVTYTPEQA